MKVKQNKKREEELDKKDICLTIMVASGASIISLGLFLIPIAEIQFAGLILIAVFSISAMAYLS